MTQQVSEAGGNSEKKHFLRIHSVTLLRQPIGLKMTKIARLDRIEFLSYLPLMPLVRSRTRALPFLQLDLHEQIVEDKGLLLKSRRTGLGHSVRPSSPPLCGTGERASHEA